MWQQIRLFVVFSIFNIVSSAVVEMNHPALQKSEKNREVRSVNCGNCDINLHETYHQKFNAPVDFNQFIISDCGNDDKNKCTHKPGNTSTGLVPTPPRPSSPTKPSRPPSPPTPPSPAPITTPKPAPIPPPAPITTPKPAPIPPPAPITTPKPAPIPPPPPITTSKPTPIPPPPPAAITTPKPAPIPTPPPAPTPPPTLASTTKRPGTPATAPPTSPPITPANTTAPTPTVKFTLSPHYQAIWDSMHKETPKPGGRNTTRAGVCWPGIPCIYKTTKRPKWRSIFDMRKVATSNTTYDGWTWNRETETWSQDNTTDVWIWDTVMSDWVLNSTEKFEDISVDHAAPGIAERRRRNIKEFLLFY